MRSTNINIVIRGLVVSVIICLAGACADPDEDLPCNIDSDTKLTDRNPDGVDYVVRCETEVKGALLSIDPGVSIVFESGTSLMIHEDAALAVNGTASEPITMRGEEAGASWKGILLRSDDNRNKIDHLDLRNTGSADFLSDVFGGSTWDFKIALGITGKASVTNTHISACGGVGVVYGVNSAVTQFSGNKIEDCGSFPVVLYAGDLTDELSFSNSEFLNNTENYIALYGKTSNTTVENAVKIAAAPVPYLAITSLIFRENTDFEAGVELRVAEGNGLVSEGTTTVWNINGTESAPVNIKGRDEAAADYWKGLLVAGGSTGVFSYLNVSGGGYDYTGFNVPHKANINVTDTVESHLTLNHCTSALNTSGCDVGVRTGNGDTTFMNNSAGLSVCTD